MSESAVLSEPVMEMQVPAPAPAIVPETPPTVRRERRFAANLRFNGFRYLTLACCLLSVWGLVAAATWLGTAKPESTFLLVLAGGLLAAAAKTGIDILNWAETTRQATHLERVRAIERLFERAGTVREQALLDWRRIHTKLVDNLSGQPQEIRLFHDHDETDRQADKLVRKALSEELWIRSDGVEAVRRFKKWIAALDYDALASETEFTEAFGTLMDRMRRDLAVAALGITLG
ncbi:MAG TPA: hypothetical protein VFV19_14760 [Candidatus Polarisedimenticolaceae bacterium]|nr:hypothetical protein [Candidatus Polarisedimenticolaceae bacterium]